VAQIQVVSRSVYYTYLCRPGVFEFLERAKQLGISLYIFTQSKRDYASLLRSLMESRLGRIFEEQMFTREDFESATKHFPEGISANYFDHDLFSI
jgi:hypothetical protein